MKRTDPKWYSKMNPEKLDALAAGVDQEYDLSALKPLTPAMRKAERAARRKKPGRPRVGLGAAKLRISMEKALLRRVDAYAHTHGLSRSELIARSLRDLLAAG